MKSTILYALLALVLAVVPVAATAQGRDNNIEYNLDGSERHTLHLTGTVGKYPVVMELTYGGYHTYGGRYYYVKKGRRPQYLYIGGDSDREGIYLTEYDGNERELGSFELHFDPDHDDVVFGVYERADQVSFPVRLKVKN